MAVIRYNQENIKNMQGDITMNNKLSQECFDSAKKSAKKIAAIEIVAEPKFYFAESQESNSIDEDFIASLEKGEHLNDNFLDITE